MAGVRLERLTKSFGSTQAVAGVDLTIPDGEFAVFVGPSGCGKTTTLNLIAGLETPTSGDIHIGADRVTAWEPRDRNLGMVFQSLALFPHMTVADNIGFPLRLKKVAARHAPFEARARGLGSFPNVLWVGVEGDGMVKPIRRMLQLGVPK